MWTPLSALRRWVRREAVLALSTEVEGIRSSLQTKVLDLLSSWPEKAVTLADEEALPKVDSETVLLDRSFDKPTVVSGYIDATLLRETDACRLRVLIYLGEHEVPLFSPPAFDGPLDECLLLREFVVTGRVRILYRQTAGHQRKISYRFFGRS